MNYTLGEWHKTPESSPMSTDAGGQDAQQGHGRSSGSSWATVVLFLIVVWLAVEMVAIRTLGTSGTGEFKQAPPAPPVPAAK